MEWHIVTARTGVRSSTRKSAKMRVEELLARPRSRFETLCMSRSATTVKDNSGYLLLNGTVRCDFYVRVYDSQAAMSSEVQ